MSGERPQISSQYVPAVVSWDEPGACHGTHLVQAGHWTNEPHHFSACHSDAVISMQQSIDYWMRKAGQA